MKQMENKTVGSHYKLMIILLTKQKEKKKTKKQLITL